MLRQDDTSSLPAISTGDSCGPLVAGEILLINIDDIDVGERLLPVGTSWAAALGRLMKVDGQRTPIEICKSASRKRWRLVAGAHRLEGARLQGWKQIRAIVVDDGLIERKLREIGENIWRRKLLPLDRAISVGEMYDLLRARAGVSLGKSGRSLAAEARWKMAVEEEAADATAMIANAYGIDDQIGELLGLSARTIRNDLTIRRRLTTADVARLRAADHPVFRSGGQLLALAKLDDTERAGVIDKLIDGAAQTVAEALDLLQPTPKPAPRDKRMAAFTRAFSAMPPTDKRGALDELSSLLSRSMADHLINALKRGGWL